VAAAVSEEESCAEKLRGVPELKPFGSVFCSSKPIDLTESETEYVVSCIKHFFPQHLVLQVQIGFYST
jgi:coatomer protein complex subunit gamma